VDVFGLAVQSGGAFLRDAALAAGHELGVFEALARRGPASLDELAGTIGVASGRHRLRALLDVLAALGAIRGDRPTGAPPRFAAATEMPPHPVVARAGWGLLADVIRSDRALPNELGADADGTRRFHRHLADAGAAAAHELAGSFDSTSLLDLGAGAGTYSKAFLAEHPTGRATLVDTPEVLGLAAEWLGPLAARAQLVEGDASVVAAGDGHGAVLLANLLHLHSPAMCARLVAAAARAVAPGGVVVIKDLRIDEDRAGPLEGLLFALNMAAYTDAGDVYPTSQLRGWLAGAGLVDITERRLAAAPDAIVVTARRPHDSAESGAPQVISERVDDGVESGAMQVSGERADAVAKTGAPQVIGGRVDAAVESGAPQVIGGRADDVAETGAPQVIGGRADDATDPWAGDDHEGIAAELDAALARTADAAWRELVASGAIRPDAEAHAPVLAFPRAVRRFLAAAIALERSDAEIDNGAAERAERLVHHYTDTMPRMRVAQLAGTAEPGATLFHTPLDWARLPRLGAAIDRLFALLADAGVAAVGALGAASADAFRARTPTLAALYARTHYGGFMPLLYGFPADLAYMHARGLAEGLDTLATIDRYLTAPIVHELCHFAPDRIAIAPPHLDECIAGWLGVYIHPELAYPADDHDDALYAAPWLAQVGHAIARAFGIPNLVRAHAGGDHAALPRSFVTAAARLGWDDWRARRTLHLLSDTFDPAPWVALALALAGGADRVAGGADRVAGGADHASGEAAHASGEAAHASGEAAHASGEAARASAGLPLSGSTETAAPAVTLAALAAIPLAALEPPADPDFDRAIVEDGLRAMCLASSQIAGSFRTRVSLPTDPILIDAVACAIIAPRRGAFDPIAPRYWLPPAVASRIVAQHGTGYALRLHSITSIPAAAAAICEASPGSEHEGFVLTPRL
jgi:hypothetical protein